MQLGEQVTRQRRFRALWASSRKSLKRWLYALPSKEPAYNCIFAVHFLLYCMYFWYNFHIVYILLRIRPTKKSSVPKLTKSSQVFNSHFLMVPCETFPSANLRFWIFWNWFELIWGFWAIALGNTPTCLQSDSGPSSFCLIPGSDRYNSVLFFALLTCWFNYAEKECISAVLC